MSEFHLLRPWWLLALIPCGLVLWQLRNHQDPLRRWQRLIAPELLPHLLVHSKEQNRITPWWMLSVCWGLVVLALTGPTWHSEPAPFGDDTAVVAIVLKVTPSMQAEDIAPTRLVRAVQKIHDLLKLRPGAKTGLIAYSGTSHQVLPLTTDGSIFTSFASELAPNVLPVEGDAAAAALNLAEQVVHKSGSPGWILWIADAVSPDQVSSLQKPQKGAAVPVTVLAMSGTGPEHQSLIQAASALNYALVSVTPDDDDVRRLAANTHFSSASSDAGERWSDSGYWLVPVLSAICLGWFRRGWVIGDLS